MMWRSEHQSLFTQCLLAMGGKKERIKNYIYLSGDAEVSFRWCNISSWGICGVAILPWYVGPSVGDWGRISPACGAKI